MVQSFSIDDALYCQEQHFDEVDDDNYSSFMENNYFINYTNHNNIDVINTINNINNKEANKDSEMLLLEQDVKWENDELPNLLSKQEQKNHIFKTLEENTVLREARKEAVDWMLKVHGHYSFNIVTALLGVDYFDRFLVSSNFQKDKQWMIQLAAIACLSIAAKVEETHVPLLLDFQVVESKYVFEAKTIQRMEILVLSTLQWKMNPVTPYSYLDYFTRRVFHPKGFLCLEFLRRCEMILLSTINDCRFMDFLPSVLATAIILQVINGLEPCIGDEYQNLLVDTIGIDKEKVDECYELILCLEAGPTEVQSNKRKLVAIPSSPNGVIDVSFNSDSSNDSWAVMTVCSSSPGPLSKKIKMVEGQHLGRFILPSKGFVSILQ